MGSLRCLVTGGAGFVGSHLCDRLLDAGHEVVVVDNFLTGRRKNVAHRLGTPGFQLVEHDVVTPLPDTGPLAARFDRIYLLACPASPPRYQADPIYTTKISFLGTLYGLERAVRDGARVLLASTSEIYGEPEVHPQPESYRGSVSTTGPRACYDEGKRVAETLVSDFRRVHDVDARIARIFNTYGPRMDPDDGRVVSNFLVQALRGESVTIYGDGQQSRSFCFVSDLVEGLVQLMEHATEAGPVNLGNEEEHSMLSLAELAHEIAKVRGAPREGRISFHPRPVDDPTQRRPDLSHARRVLGFAPRVGVREGLLRTAEYFATEGGAAESPQAR
ncbi:MAG: UDP-glucuronic acid decarboxylase family protein [Sandaracinus sp.]